MQKIRKIQLKDL